MNAVSGRRSLGVPAALGLMLGLLVSGAGAQDLPELTRPVNDFARIIDAAHAQAMDGLIRSLQATTGDVVVVATLDTFAPYGDLRELATKLFENHGRGIGEKGKHNGLLITLAVKERRVWIEVGYGLEEFVTDGYAGETTRLYMIPEFRQGAYGAGLEAGVRRIVGRLAQARGVTLAGAPPPEPPRPQPRGSSSAGVIGIILLVLLVSALSSLGRRGGPRRWGRGPWSGWSSGVGPFGGGVFGGGFGGFGGGGGLGGGGFGGFGGGGSGGGGGGGSW